MVRRRDPRGSRRVAREFEELSSQCKVRIKNIAAGLRASRQCQDPRSNREAGIVHAILASFYGPSGDEGQSMKVFVASIFALLVGSSTAVAQDISAKDFDLACAVTASAVVASSPKGAAERDAAMWLWSFYLGRLSGRDDKTFWAMVSKGRLAALGETITVKDRK